MSVAIIIVGASERKALVSVLYVDTIGGVWEWEWEWGSSAFDRYHHTTPWGLYWRWLCMQGISYMAGRCDETTIPGSSWMMGTRVRMVSGEWWRGE